MIGTNQLNRLIARSSANGYNVPIAYSPSGQRTNMIDFTGVTGYTYDKRDRLLSKGVNRSNGPSVWLNNSYDAAGNLTNLFSTNLYGGSVIGVTNCYQFDPLNRLINVLAGGLQAAAYGFDKVGNLQSMICGNGVTNQYSYDSLNRLTSLANTKATFFYQFGAAGMRCWFVGIALILVGCSDQRITVEEKLLPRKNPSSFDFDAAVPAVKDAIKEARGEKWRDAQPPNEASELAWAGDGSPFASRVSLKNGKDDAYLYGMGNSVGNSKVYFRSGKALPYYADFLIHLAPITDAKTRVEIYTFESHVTAGTELLPFARAGVFASVAPTSIEKYQILLDIGKQLAARGMPELVLPASNSPTKKLRASRWR